MKNLIISEQLANGILQYLGRHPYVDVAAMIQAMLQLQEVKQEKELNEPDKGAQDGKDGV